MNHEKTVSAQRLRRRRRVRKAFRGVAERPRLTVFRSHKHIYCQIIDDETSKTLASASTRDRGLRSSIKNGGNSDAARIVGKTLADRAIELGVKSVSLDRGQYKYHGRVAALADAAREAGLVF